MAATAPAFLEADKKLYRKSYSHKMTTSGVVRVMIGLMIDPSQRANTHGNPQELPCILIDMPGSVLVEKMMRGLLISALMALYKEGQQLLFRLGDCMNPK